MRTKTTLAAAALLAAGLASSMAQNVYSLNIVGYVNKTITSGQLALLANPLKPSDGNYDINNTVKLQDPGSDGTVMFQWNAAGSSWVAYGYEDGFGWDTAANANLGQGFFLQPTLTQTITFVGEVQTGTFSTAIPTGMTLLGNKAPVVGPVPGSTVGNDGDVIFTWNAPGNSWVASGYEVGFGWDTASIEGPVMQIAEGFFYQNTGAALNWSITLNP